METLKKLLRLSRSEWPLLGWGLLFLTLSSAALLAYPHSIKRIIDEAIAQKITAAAGKRVTLNYEQHKGLPTSCFGDTDYFVTGVTEIE